MLKQLISLRVCVLSCSVVSDSVTPWTVARQAPLSMEFSRQESWSRRPFPSPGDLPNPETEPNLCLLSLLHCRQILYHCATREAQILPLTPFES